MAAILVPLPAGSAAIAQFSGPLGRADCRIALDFRDAALSQLREASREAAAHTDALGDLRYRSNLTQGQKERFDALIDAVESYEVAPNLLSFLDDLLQDRCGGAMRR